VKNITKKLFVYSLILAIIAAGMLYFYLKSVEQGSSRDAEKIKILVAAKDIPARTKISKDMIKEIEITKDDEDVSFIQKSEEVVDKYSKEAIYKDERFNPNMLLMEIKEELSLSLGSGFRAITIMVNLESGVADLIKPSDFVDVIVYLPEIKDSQQLIRPDIAKVVLEKAEVVAVDQNLYRESPERKEEPKAFYITLAVPVGEVEKVVLAQNIGTLKLALRPVEGKGEYDSEGIIWPELLIDSKKQPAVPQEDKAQNADSYKLAEELVKRTQVAIEENNSIKVEPSETVKTTEPTKTTEPQVTTQKPQSQTYKYHTVVKGDTLMSIARKYYNNDASKYKLIMSANNLPDTNIKIGMKLKIPVQ